MAVPSACLQLSASSTEFLVSDGRLPDTGFSSWSSPPPPPPPTARDKIKDKARPISIIYNVYVAPSSVNVQRSRMEGESSERNAFLHI
ncbi:hypothetical protein E4U32_000655 [Claviceps aff. humidiphila group G2b]|nr:hypothetical protein E4U32_000655 [Claviceps aff. humidiphila group G2b]